MRIPYHLARTSRARRVPVHARHHQVGPDDFRPLSVHPVIAPDSVRIQESPVSRRSSLRPWADRPLAPPTPQVAGRLLWIAVLLLVLGLLLSSAEAAPGFFEVAPF